MSVKMIYIYRKAARSFKIASLYDIRSIEGSKTTWVDLAALQHISSSIRDDKTRC